MAGPPDTQYGLVGSRLGFRLGYLPEALEADRETVGIFRLDDRPVKVRRGTTTIHDVINDTPNTCALTIDAATPPNSGQRLTIKINANKPRLLFAGPLQTVGLTYELQPHQTVYPCQAIDDTPLSNRKLPYGQWVNTSATTVAQWLVTTFAPGFTATHVQAGLPPVSVNFDATEGMDGCLRQIAKLIGGYFYWESRDLHLFLDGEPGDTPDPIDDSHAFLNDPAISVSVDSSQVRTRVYGKGYAEEIIADVAANETIVPISNAVMFNPAGGQAVSETQRLRYTGLAPGGGGTIVGPGIAPAAAPQATIVTGAGITPGLHDYAVSFVTGVGESLVGPRVSVNVGLLPPPQTPMTATAKPGGAGPDAGSHWYGCTFVTASGETATITPAWTGYTQPQIAAGTVPIGPISDAAAPVGYSELHPGDTIVLYYTYASTSGQPPAANGLNQTGFGPASAGYVIKVGNGGLGRGFSFYVPFSADPNVKTVFVWISTNFQPMKLLFMGTGGGLLNQPGFSSGFYSYVSGAANSGIPQPTGAIPIVGGVTLSQIPIGPAGVTGRKLYRGVAPGSTQLKLLATLGDNTTTTYLDTTADAALGANVPTVGTAVAAQVALSGIPLSQAAPTNWRRIYRSKAGTTALQLVTTITDNVTTAYVDALADASLGANAPTGDTSGLQQPAGMVLAGAPSMVVAGAGWASVLGGWAIIGNGQQAIRYTGISGNTLTGIPPSGPGAITATISYNSTVTGAAALLGVTGLLRALIKGAPINLWVQRDDLTWQASIAATDGTDGIIEHLITDERRGEASLTQLCDADLAQYAPPIQTVPYATHDTKTKSGKPVTFNLASPAIHATLTIQEVTITEIDMYPRTNPRFTVSASSVRFSLEDILRRLGASLDVTS